MSEDSYTIYIEKDAALSEQTYEAFRQSSQCQAIDTPELDALPARWSGHVTFERGLRLLSLAKTDHPDSYFAMTIEDAKVVEICCNSPLMLKRPLVSVRLVRVGEPAE